VPIAFYLGDPINNPLQAELIGTAVIPVLQAENNTIITAVWDVTQIYGQQV